MCGIVGIGSQTPGSDRAWLASGRDTMRHHGPKMTGNGGRWMAASVWALMKKASVFVSLSAYEGCPNTVMEAMACGCPIIVSDIPEHREILDEQSALFVTRKFGARWLVLGGGTIRLGG